MALPDDLTDLKTSITTEIGTELSDLRRAAYVNVMKAIAHLEDAIAVETASSWSPTE